MRKARVDSRPLPALPPVDLLPSRRDGALLGLAASQQGAADAQSKRDRLAPAIRTALGALLLAARARWEAERRDPDSAEAQIASDRQVQAEERLAETILAADAGRHAGRT